MMVFHQCLEHLETIWVTKCYHFNYFCSATSLPNLYARVGSTTYNSGGQIVKVEKYVVHPQYSRDTLDYDFAIASFAAGVEIALGTNVQVIQLSSGQDPAVGSSIIVSGWGVLSVSISLKFPFKDTYKIEYGFHVLIMINFIFRRKPLQACPQTSKKSPCQFGTTPCAETFTLSLHPGRFAWEEPLQEAPARAS